MPFTAMVDLASADQVMENDMDALRGNITYLHAPPVTITARGAISTTSTTFADIAGLSAVHTAYGGVTTIMATLSLTDGGGIPSANVALDIDGTDIAYGHTLLRGTYNEEIATLVAATGLASGAHVIKVQWSVNAGTTATMSSGTLTVMGG